MRKITFFYGHFLAFFWVFWRFYPCQYGSEGYNFWFTHTDNHYKLDYKLLTSYAYLILTLYIVRNDKKSLFLCVLGGGARLHANASYGQMGVRLIARWVSNPFSLVTSTKSLSVVPQNTGYWPQDRSFSLLGMEGSYYGLGLLSSWRYPVASRRDGG